MYPLKFDSLYYEKIWGGKGSRIPRQNVPEGKVGESWDIACHPKGVSVVKNGHHKGIRLDELIKIKGEDLVGSKIPIDDFPLLVKILNTSERLSVQVHPDDDYGFANEGEMGKTEAWYVLEAEEGASIIIGTKGCTKEEFKKAIYENNVEEYMNKLKVKKGDVFYIKSGLVHSIGAGILMVEIQQSSDTTYRVYDYNRGRKLHIDKALEVIDFEIEGKKSNGLKVEMYDYDKIYYCLNKHFSLELYNVLTSISEASDTERFYIFTCVEGSGIIRYKNGEEKIKIGDSVLIPAKLGEYEIIGNLKLLKSYVPDMSKVENEILQNIN